MPPTREALTRALDGIYLDAGIAIEFEISPHGRDIGQHFAADFEARWAGGQLEVAYTDGPLGNSEAGLLVRTGPDESTRAELGEALAAAAGTLNARLVGR